MGHSGRNSQLRAEQQWFRGSYPRSSVPRTLHPEAPSITSGTEIRGAPYVPAHPGCGGLAYCTGCTPSQYPPKLRTSAVGDTSPALHAREKRAPAPKPCYLPNGRESKKPLTGMCTRNMSFFWLELFLLLLLLEVSFFLSMAVLPIPSPRRGAGRCIWKGRLLFPSPRSPTVPSYSRLLIFFFLFFFLIFFLKCP